MHVAIIHRSPILRAGLRSALRGQVGMRVTAELSGVFPVELPPPPPDVILLEAASTAGFAQVLRGLAVTVPAARVVLLGPPPSESVLQRLLGLGLRGVLHPDCAADLLLRCIRRVAAGDLWVPRHAACSWIIARLRNESGSQELTEREADIIRLVLQGRSNREIARQLAIRLPTVKRHLANLMEKVGVHSRSELAQVAEVFHPTPAAAGADQPPRKL